MEAKESAHVLQHAGASVNNDVHSGTHLSFLQSRHTTILPECLDNTLSTTTAERALPAVALELHPQLRGTVWHRIGLRDASTILARALLGADEQVTTLAHWIARMLMVSGDVTSLDTRVIVLGDGVAVAFGDRSVYIQRGQQP